jgi:protein-tyrosine-phosphatase
MHIHFVCTGNVYRSRLAETYVKSLQVPRIEVSSSGVQANDNSNGPISWYAMRIIYNQKIHTFVKPQWEQTTKEILDNADIIVFMTAYQYEYVVKHLSYAGSNHKIWYIDDIVRAQHEKNEDILLHEMEIIKVTEETYANIMHKSQALLQEIKK